MLEPEARRPLRAKLLRWYDRHRRDLPWRRREGDGYAQLLAEFMLQQTQVATVVGYFERFMARYPTVSDLAAADLDDVLALWSGLGYYRRARNLHAAARMVVEEFGGQVPADVDTLMRLPGVGRYTAGAIASIAYDTRAPVLDGNVIRVMSRVLGIEENVSSPPVQRHLWEQVEQLLPRRDVGRFNQAMMELGATVCAPRSPNCLLCPLRSLCAASQRGATDRIPSLGKRAKVLPGEMVVAAVRRGETLLFVQRPANGLWAGLWELPGVPVNGDESIATARARLRRLLPAGAKLATKPLGQVTRLLSHRRLTFHVYNATIPGGRRITTFADQPARWLRMAQLSDIGLSRACEAVLKLVVY